MKAIPAAWLILTGLLLSGASPAQIVTDGTVGLAGPLAGPNFAIPNTLGTQLGANLFHSFSEFNVNLGESATFTSDFAGITRNVISRVTGGNSSSINGTLRSSISGADLWLINPNGVAFGSGATLDIAGGLHVSTASSLYLDDGGSFLTSDPGASSLTIGNPAAFGFLLPPAPVSVEGALAVPVGRSLSLAGGGINVIGGQIAAPGGRISLVALGSSGQLELDVDGNPLSESIDLFSDLADIRVAPSLSSDAQLDASADAGGTIFSRGRQFALDGFVFADSTDGFGADVAVDLLMRESIVLQSGSFVTADVSGTGSGGDLRFSAPAIQGTGSTLASRTFSLADQGTGDIHLSGGLIDLFDTRIQSESATPGTSGNVTLFGDLILIDGFSVLRTGSAGSGRGGDVSLTGGSVLLDGGSVLKTATTGFGRAGDILVLADDGVVMRGVDVSGFGSLLESTSDNTSFSGAGGAGDIRVQANVIDLSDGTLVRSKTEGSGNAGDVKLVASESIALSGFDTLFNRTSVFSESLDAMFPDAGSTGTVELTAPRVSVTDGGFIAVRSRGAGITGSVRIAASDTLDLGGFGFFEPSAVLDIATVQTFGLDGGPGSVRIEAGNITLHDAASIDNRHSGAGASGSISVEAVNIELAGGSLVLAGTEGDGDGSTIEIHATGSVDVHDTDPFGSPSSIASGAADLTTGSSGSIVIRAKDITVSGGAKIESLTNGAGNAGDVTLEAANRIQVEGGDLSGIPSLVRAATDSTGSDPGDGGKISLLAAVIEVLDGGTIDASTDGAGLGGAIDLSASQSISLRGLGPRFGSFVTSGSFGTLADSARGGDITLSAPVIELLDGAIVGTSSLGPGNAGSILATATESITLSGINASGITSQLNAITLGSGAAGDIDVRAPVIQVSDRGGFSSDTSGIGQAGNILVSSSESLTLNGGFIKSETNATTGGDAGAILIEAPTVTLADGALVATSTFGSGAAGNITIRETGLLLLSGSDADGFSSLISSKSADGSGDAGTILLDVTTLRLDDGGFIDTSTAGTGVAGQVVVTADTATMSGADGNGFSAGISSRSESTADDGGAAGAISITANTVDMRDGALLQTGTLGGGDAGQITLIADVIDLSGVRVTGEGSGIISTSDGVSASGGDGGSVTLDARVISFAEGGFANTATASGGRGGDITVVADESFSLSGVNGNGNPAALFANTTGDGTGGRIRVEAQEVLVDGAVISAATGGAGPGGSIQLAANDVRLVSGALVSAATLGSGPAGGVVIGGFLEGSASASVVVKGSSILSDSRSAGAGSGSAGAIDVRANELTLGESALVSASTLDGQGGAIGLAIGALDLSEGAQISAITSGAGAAGAISIGGQVDGRRSARISLAAGAGVTTSAAGTGTAGDISILAEEVTIAGAEASVASSSTGQNAALGGQAGKAGNIVLTATGLKIEDGARIAATTVDGEGPDGADSGSEPDGGTITLSIANEMTMNDDAQVTASSSGFGNAGDIRVTVGSLPMTDGARISSASTGGGATPLFEVFPAAAVPGRFGNAGAVSLTVESLMVGTNSVVETRSAASAGGNILISATGTAFLDGGTISTSTRGLQAGDSGGNIALAKPQLLVLRDGQIRADANAGPGGNISITTVGLIKNVGSVISASSEQSIDGVISTNAENTVGAILDIDLPSTGPPESLGRRCSPTEVAERSTFVVRGNRPVEIRSPYLPLGGVASAVLGNQGVACAMQAPAR